MLSLLVGVKARQRLLIIDAKRADAKPAPSESDLRMSPLDTLLSSLRRDLERAFDRHGSNTKEQITSELNRVLRRLRQYEKEDEWVTTLLDSVGHFASECAVFEIKENTVRLRAQQGLELIGDFTFPLTSAPAFASCVEMREPVIALRTASEVGAALAIASDVPARARLIPITNQERVAAVLFAAEQEALDGNALELIAGIASVVLERRSNADVHSQITAPVTPAASPRSKAHLPAWSDLSEIDQTLHLRAQRFSRVTVAESQLARPEACAAGRKAGDLYLFLKPELERARDAYRTQFMVTPSMVDYLHLELVRVLAGGDETMLGMEYPGALV